jgi:hypothetical protein
MKLGFAIATLLIGASASFYSYATSPDDETMDVVHVTGFIENTDVYLGPISSPVFDDWDYDGQTDTVTPPYLGAPAGVSAICALLSSQGRPKDCTRSLAEGGEARPTPEPVQSYNLLQDNYARAVLNQRFTIANVDLTACYADPSMEPIACEDDYLTTLRDCDWLYDTEFGERPRSSCHGGYSAIYERVQNSRWTRTAASWFGFKVGPAWGPIGVDINQNWVTDVLTNDYHNQLLIYARKADACSKWYMLWDGKDCSATYGTLG